MGLSEYKGLDKMFIYRKHSQILDKKTAKLNKTLNILNPFSKSQSLIV